jgi:hypothetical protein
LTRTDRIRRPALGPLLACLLLGCGGTAPAPDATHSPDAGRDGVRPPDLGSRDGLRVGNVGAPCDRTTKTGCTGAAECLEVSAAVSICAIPGCTPDDITTAAYEDDCPLLPGMGRRTICTSVQVPGGDAGFVNVNYCLPECTASPNTNSCAEVNSSLSCDPITLLLNGHAEVCLVPACSESSQCGKDPVNPGASCDKSSRTCQLTGTAGVAIGSPCLVSSDCGPGQLCLPEYTDSKTGKVVLAGGYCTIVGCNHYDASSANQLWKCPDGSKCFLLGSNQALSLCLAVGCTVGTKPGEPDGCRDEAPAGQYTCTLQSGVGVCWVDVTKAK